MDYFFYAKKLTIISFFGCKNLKGICPTIGTNVKILNLSYCKHIQFDTSMFAMNEMNEMHQKNYFQLDSLFLYECQINSFKCGIHHLSSTLINLTLDDEKFECNMEYELKNIHQLEVLKLVNCKKISGMILNNLKEWKHLKHLNLHLCENLTGCIPHHPIK